WLQDGELGRGRQESRQRHHARPRRLEEDHGLIAHPVSEENAIGARMARAPIQCNGPPGPIAQARTSWRWKTMQPITNNRIEPATRATICGQTISTLCRSEIGAPGIDPRSIRANPRPASIDCWVERTEGSSTIATISLYNTPGDSRANACWVSKTPRIS